MRTPSILAVYAVVLAATGVVVWSQAPDPSRAITALVIPLNCAALVAAVAVMVWLGPRYPRLGRVGGALAVALPLLFTLGLGFQAWRATNEAARYETARAAWEAQPGPPGERAAFLQARGAPDHDTSYKRNGLWILTAASLLCLVLVVRARRARPVALGEAAA